MPVRARYHATMTDLSAFWRINPSDADPIETREWLDAFDALVETAGRERATFLLRKLLDHARATRAAVPPAQHTPQKNASARPPAPHSPHTRAREQHLLSRAR